MKRFLSLLLCLALCLTLAACGVKAPATPAQPGAGQIVDGSGAIRDIPDEPAAATIASVYAVSVPLIVALGLSERVLAINVKSSFWTAADEHLAAAGTVGRGVVDLEALAGFDPSVLIHRSNDPETVEAVERLGVEVLCVTVENMDDIRATLTMMGTYFGVSERAAEVVAWLDQKLAMIDAITARIPEDARCTALVMGGEPGRVAGSDMLQTWMIEKAGGIPVADEGKDHNWINVGVETVFAWDPEFLFCTSSTALDYKPESLLTQEAWSAVAAVRDGHVLTMPAKLDSWDMPGISCVLGILYMLRSMYPEALSAEELQREIDDYYTFMFGRTFEAGYLGYSLES